MTRLVLSTALMLSLLGVGVSIASAADPEAKKLATEILKKGAELYDKHDAKVMAATYTEDARLLWVSKTESGEVVQSVKRGREEIESVYQEYFKNPNDQTQSRNTVEYARFVTPEMLIIQGDFEPNIAGQGLYPFVQVRVKEGDKWLIKSLQFFVFSQD